MRETKRAGAGPRGRKRHRGRWTAIALALGVPALVVPYLMLTRDDSEAAVDTAAYYQFVSVRSGNALDVAGADNADGVRIQEEKRAAGAASQQWQVKPVDGGYYQVVNHNSGKVLGVRRGAPAPANVEQQSDTGSADQQWKLSDAGGGAVKIVSRGSGMVLGVTDGSGADGQAVVQSTDRGGADQQWQLARADTPATPSAPAGSVVPKPSHSASATPPAPAGPGGYTWRNVQIAGGGFVTGFVFNPSRKGLLYARTDVGGAYRWDGKTGQWVPLTDWAADWNMYGIESVATDPVDPDRVYLASGTYTNDWAGNGAILRSTDQGRTFQRTELPFKLGGNEDGRSMGERLAIDPADHGTLYLGTRKNGLWRSTDYGVTWSQVAGFPVKDGASSGVGLSFVTFGPSKTIYVGVADKATSLYRSTDGGSTWQAVPGQPTGQLPHHGVLSGDGSLYLTYTDAPGPNGVKAGSVWKYTPSSGAWKDISPAPGNGFGYAGLAVDPQHPSTVMVTTLDRWWPSDELYRSTDGGVTWKALGATSVRDASAAPYVGTGIGHWMGALALDPFDSGHVLYGTGSGLWASDDVTAADRGGATHWTVPVKGLEETAVLGLVAPPGGKLISALGDIGGFRHDNLDKVPAAASSGPRFSNTTGIDFAQAKPNIVVRVGYSGEARGAYSTDGGATWTPFAGTPVSAAGGGTVAISADGGTVVWTASGQVPYVSTDRGATWTASSGLPKGTAVVADRARTGVFYALSGGTLFASTDGGRSFTARAGSLPGERLKAASGNAGDLWITSGGGLSHSTDGGASFSRLDSVQRADAVGFGKAAPGSRYQAVYLVGTVNGVTGIFRSTDGGTAWVRINDERHQYGGGVGAITGDPDVYGRVYLGSAAARGVLYGDPS